MSNATHSLSNPTLYLGPLVIAAIVSGLVTIFTNWWNRKSTAADVVAKIKSEIAISEKKIVSERDAAEGRMKHELASAMSDRAWADYELRRDIYLDLAKQIGCLFSSDDSSETESDHKSKKEFHETARKLRLIGSDEVVSALNTMTTSIKSSSGHHNHAIAYSNLMNAIRRDIRTLNTTPPIGTKLDSGAFPIES